MPTRIEDLDLSIRAYRRLRDAGVENLEECQDWTAERLLELPGFGMVCLREVQAAMTRAALTPPADPVRRGVWRHNQKLDRAQQAKVQERARSGESVSALAREYEISRSRVIQLRTGVRERDIRRSTNRAPVNRAASYFRKLYLTAPDAAAELGISRFTMHEYLKAGKFPGAFQIGKQGWWLVPRAAVEARKKAKSDA